MEEISPCESSRGSSTVNLFLSSVISSIFELGGTAITGGAITVAHSGSAAGDVDSSDKFLHKKRKAISKAIGKDKKEDASETKYDARSKSFKETLRRLG